MEHLKQATRGALHRRSAFGFDAPLLFLWVGLAVGLMIAISSPASAATYYVDGDDPLASDANPGTPTEPWRTLTYAATMAVAGDTVWIGGAVYNEQLATAHSGNLVDGPIHFAALPSETPVLDGTDVGWSVGLRIQHDCLTFVGLEIRGWTTGVWMTAANDVLLRDCEVHDVWYGIGAADGMHNFTLERVEVHHFTLYGFDASPSGGADCYNGTLIGCRAHTCNDPEQNVDGFALGHGEQYGFHFVRCETYGVYDGFDISARDTRLEACIAHDCTYRGLTGWRGGLEAVNCLLYDNGIMNVDLVRGGDEAQRYTLTHCTLMGAEVYNIYVDSTGAGIELELHNCILAGGDNVGLWLEQLDGLLYTGDANVFHNDNAARMIWAGGEREFSLAEIEAGEWHDFSGQDAATTVAYSAGDLFRDPAGGDFHLPAGSPALDVGSPDWGVAADLEGRPRPLGDGFDCGAFEAPVPGAVGDRPDAGGEETVDSAAARPGERMLEITPTLVRDTALLTYQLARPGRVAVRCFDVGGRLITQQLTGEQGPGIHQLAWTPDVASSGVYLLELRVAGRPWGRAAVRVVR